MILWPETTFEATLGISRSVLAGPLVSQKWTLSGVGSLLPSGDNMESLSTKPYTSCALESAIMTRSSTSVHEMEIILVLASHPQKKALNHDVFIAFLKNLKRISELQKFIFRKMALKQGFLKGGGFKPHSTLLVSQNMNAILFNTFLETLLSRYYWNTDHSSQCSSHTKNVQIFKYIPDTRTKSYFWLRQVCYLTL